jgi:hypothetical protein
VSSAGTFTCAETMAPPRARAKCLTQPSQHRQVGRKLHPLKPPVAESRNWGRATIKFNRLRLGARHLRGGRRASAVAGLIWRPAIRAAWSSGGRSGTRSATISRRGWRVRSSRQSDTGRR